MDKPDRTDVIERLNRILKKPKAAPPAPPTIREKFVAMFVGKRREIAASAAR